MEKSEPGKYSCFCNSGIVFITGPTPLVGSLLKTARSCWISHHLIGSDLDWINDQPQIWVDSDCIIQKWGSFWQKPPGPTSDFFTSWCQCQLQGQIILKSRSTTVVGDMEDIDLVPDASKSLVSSDAFRKNIPIVPIVKSLMKKGFRKKI